MKEQEHLHPDDIRRAVWIVSQATRRWIEAGKPATPGPTFSMMLVTAEALTAVRAGTEPPITLTEYEEKLVRELTDWLAPQP